MIQNKLLPILLDTVLGIDFLDVLNWQLGTALTLYDLNYFFINYRDIKIDFYRLPTRRRSARRKYFVTYKIVTSFYIHHSLCTYLVTLTEYTHSHIRREERNFERSVTEETLFSCVKMF